MSYSQYVLHKFMDMSSLLGTMLGTIPSYKRDPYVHPYWSLGKPNSDRSSCRDCWDCGTPGFLEVMTWGIICGFLAPFP